MYKKAFNLCVVGLGYVGLPTACIFATKGMKVLGVDTCRKVVDLCNQSRAPFSEPDLDILLKAAVNSGNLKASFKADRADHFVITVPTPFRIGPDQERIPDTSLVEAATRSIAPFLHEDNLVILESTSPVGTTEMLRTWVCDERAKRGLSDIADAIHYAYCPERVLPGQLLRELVANDRICGGLTDAASQRAAELFGLVSTGEVVKCTARVAELVKLAENAFRDVNIAFANELHRVAEELKIDVWSVIELANKHPRVKILNPGPGVGGHCVAVDPWFIVSSAPQSSRLIRVAREVNDSQPQHLIAQIVESAARFQRPVIACLGLTYKANVGDMRESPALIVANGIVDRRVGKLLVVEPQIEELPESLKGGAKLVSMPEALRAADIVVVLVDHREFGRVRPVDTCNKVLIDTRGIWRTG